MGRKLGLVLILGALLGGKPVRALGGPVSRGDAQPGVMLWAWERPEDLRFLEGRPDVGVAFLAETLIVRGAELHVSPRRQPLRVAETTPLDAVVRVEWVRGVGIDDSAALRAQIAQRFVEATKLPRVRGVQIDFDAPESDRPFYRELLHDIRAALPPATPFSMTAVASWCTSEASWLATPGPVEGPDEVVPMVFAMGRDTVEVHLALEAFGSFPAGRCEDAVGVEVGERMPSFARSRKAYVFDRHAWTRADFDSTMSRLRPDVGGSDG